MVASPFEKNLDDLMKFVVALSSLFVVASAFAPPPQKTVEPPSGCSPSYEVYLRTAFLRYYFVCMTSASYGLATCIKCVVRHVGGIQHLGAKAQRTARLLAVVAALLSSAGMALAVATYVLFVQATTVVRTCFPAADAVAIGTTYVLVGLLCIISPAAIFGGIALYAE